MSNNKVTISSFYCTQCGNESIPLPRKIGQAREAGHLKELYCIHCKKTVNHVEVRHFGSYTKEDFDLEFTTGRFLEDGTRIPIKDLPSCKYPKCPCNVNGKCWNSNGSYSQWCLLTKIVCNSGNKDYIETVTGCKEEEE